MNELVREKKNARKEASNLVKEAKGELDTQKAEMMTRQEVARKEKKGHSSFSTKRI